MAPKRWSQWDFWFFSHSETFRFCSHYKIPHAPGSKSSFKHSTSNLQLSTKMFAASERSNLAADVEMNNGRPLRNEDYLTIASDDETSRKPLSAGYKLSLLAALLSVIAIGIVLVFGSNILREHDTNSDSPTKEGGGRMVAPIREGLGDVQRPEFEWYWDDEKGWVYGDSNVTAPGK
eukprot:g22068.t1